MLPIEEYLPEIIKNINEYNNLVLQAEPGAGKSTVVPLKLITSNMMLGKKVIMLEPRRVAVKAIAHYLASQLNENVGETVGYQIRNERIISKNTLLEIVTEGVLTRRIQNDPELNNIGLIIFDEFHERSIHADLALNLALEVQEAYRDDLKLLVMSATIDTELLSNYLGNSKVVKCPGRAFPVEIGYAGKPSSHLSEHIKYLLGRIIKENTSGDILVFLSGQAEIKRCINAVQNYLPASVKILPLYGSLSLSEQELALKKDGARRVIFSTNLAETSLTIDGISFVIDSGLEKVMKFDVKSGLSRLDTTRISKASAAQRAGRAGRTQGGYCLRLWSELEQKELDEYQIEEINVADLTNLVLELVGWGITNYDDVNWLTAPPLHHFEIACKLNYTLGLLDSSNKITSLGQKVLALGVDARLGSMLLSCKTEKEKLTACFLAALLSERDILSNADSSDITDRLLIVYDSFIGKAISRNVHNAGLRQVTKLARSFANTLNINLDLKGITFFEFQSSVGTLLLKAYPDRLAKIRSKNSTDYLLANGRGVSLREADTLVNTNWLVVCDCDGKNSGGKIYISAPIAFSDVIDSLEDKLNTKVCYKLDSKKENIIGRRIYSYMSLIVQEDRLNVISDSDFNSCINDILLAEGLKFLRWSKKSENWLIRCRWLSSTLDSFPIISEERLLKSVDTWLLPYIESVKSIKALKNIEIYSLLITNLTWEQQQLLDECAPITYLAPSGKEVEIRYDENQGPTVSVVLQEMFGQIESPLLAMGKVPIRFELLSPAKRPIQTTSDLGQFWLSSYFDVAKDMRGRYPKHRWPEKPLEEKPGQSIKRKKSKPP
ncbi:ATP-dependent helicase HrpB [Pseudoalteromonas ostreae]|uniref:ATP-dependent helicase HrpB n=1 Tax=Pseudoalteromonas ostreae TaxID=2774154 RepID=UPI001B388059|nr:ATP-dependent helicase HrpB [Pseudoalteromonas ostreae]